MHLQRLFHQLRTEMTATLQRFQDLQNGVVDSTLDRGALAALAQTSEFGNSRVPGIRLDSERIMTVLRLLGRIATDPRGFNSSQLRELYSAETGLPYSSSQASYDLKASSQAAPRTRPQNTTISLHSPRRSPCRFALQTPCVAHRPHSFIGKR